MDRREFIMLVTAGALSHSVRRTGGKDGNGMQAGDRTSSIAAIRTADRATGIGRAIGLLGIDPVRGNDVLLKPNFNTADPFPGSTHDDTLVHLVRHLKKLGAKSITVGERSGPPDTAEVLEDKGIYDLAKQEGFGIVNFEDLPERDWVRIRPAQCSWNNGFEVAKPVLDAKCIVTTCCLKTHAYGGVFTMSLKLSVGITRKRNMAELHSSFRSMRRMIAEINAAYTPALVVMDAIEAFTDGGPGRGTRRRADVIIAGTDRVAVDAVGLAMLKDLGSNKEIMDRRIFDQEQISRAVELGLGVSRPEDITILSDDDEGKRYAERLTAILRQG
jgi:uncharacterized protein (DUF362 family)